LTNLLPLLSPYVKPISAKRFKNLKPEEPTGLKRMSTTARDANGKKNVKENTINKKTSPLKPANKSTN
jgi:hypothetical protein